MKREIDPRIQEQYSGSRIKFLSYAAVTANARTQIEWFLNRLNEVPGASATKEGSDV